MSIAAGGVSAARSDERGARVRLTLVGVGIAALMLTLFIAGGRRADTAASGWTAGDAVQVTAVNVAADGARTGVTLSWPAPAVPVGGFEVRREGTVVATVSGDVFTATDTRPDTGAVALSYTVNEVAGGVRGATLGAPEIRFPDAATGCTLLWTGSSASSSSWSDPRNWAPYGPAGLQGEVRAPTATDHVCVDHEVGLPIVVDTAPNSVDRFTGTWLRPATLRVVAGGELKVLGRAQIPALEMAGGILQLQDDSNLLWASRRDPLVLGGGELIIDKVLDMVDTTGATRGNAVVLGGTITTLTGGELRAGGVDLGGAGTKQLIGQGGHRLITADVELGGDNSLTIGTGGATLVTGWIAINDGTSRVGWPVDRGLAARLDLKSDGGTLTIDDFVDLAADDRILDAVSIDLGGEVILGEPVEVIRGGVSVRGSGSLRTGGSATPFAGLREVEGLSARQSAVVRIPGNFTADNISLFSGSELAVTGTLGAGPSESGLISLDDATLSFDQPSTLPARASMRIGNGVDIFGDLTHEGQILAIDNDGVAWADATFHDDLTLANTSILTVGAATPEPDRSTAITVLGTLTLDGTLDTRIAGVLPDGTDLRVVRTTKPPVGGFDTISVAGDDAAGIVTEVLDDGIHIRKEDTGVGGDCATNLPQVESMGVGGCWVERVPNEVWMTSDVIAPAPTDRATIGSLAFDPHDGVELYLDFSDSAAPSLYAQDPAAPLPAGSAGLVDVTTMVGFDTVSEAIEWSDVAIDWVLNRVPNDLGVTDLLGLPVETAVVRVDETWQLTGDVVLPRLFDAVTAPFEVIDDGAALAGVITDKVDLAVDGVIEFADTSVTYLGGETWALDNTGAIGATIDAVLDYTDGALQVGSIGVENLQVAGFRIVDTTLTYNAAAATWLSDAIAGDGQPVVRLVESVSDGVAASSRFVFGTVELGIATIDESFALNRSAAGWLFVGSADIVDRTVALSSSAVSFARGALQSAVIELGGSYGQLAEFEDLRLTYPATRPASGADRSLPLFDVDTSVRSGTQRQVAAGSLAMRDGALEFLQIPVALTVGELGNIAGAVSYDPTTGVLGLVGAGGSGPAQFTCGDRANGGERSSDIVTDTPFVGGRPASGSLQLGQWCFGPAVLDNVGLVYNSTEKSYDLAGRLGVDAVAGSLRFAAGTIEVGAIDLPAYDINGWLPVPAMTLAHRSVGGADTFGPDAASVPGDLLRGFEIGFSDGRLIAGGIRLGDALGVDLADLVADAAGLLPVGGVDLVYDESTGEWVLDAFLDEPAVAFGGRVGIDNGQFTSGSFAIAGMELGSLARMNLTFTVDGLRRFAVTGSLQGVAFSGNRAVTGSLTFADGALSAGDLVLDQFPIGELLTIDQFRLASTGGVWQVSGDVVTSANDTAVAGSLKFTDGDLVAASLDVTDLHVGPSVVDRLSFGLDAAGGIGAYDIAGVVRGPNVTGGPSDAAGLVEFAGSATIVDGDLVGMSMQLPYLEIGSLAYLRDLDLSYSDVAGDTTLSGAASIVSADDAAATPSPRASFTAILADGVTTSAQITAQRLSLGGLVAIEALDLQYDARSAVSCGLVANRETPVWSLAGATAHGGSVDGCFAFNGRAMVAAELDAVGIGVGELFEIESLSARFRSQATYDTTLLDPSGADLGKVELSRTSLDLAAIVTAANLDPIAVTGAMEFTDGGLSQLSFEVPRLPLSATVELVDVAVVYDQAGRWDGVSDTEFSLAGSAVHAGGQTNAEGSLSFSPTGRLVSANLAIDDMPLGPFDIDRLLFSYSGGPTSVQWAIGGEITPPGGATSSLDGTAQFTDGKLVAATLRVPRASIGELVLLSAAELQFTRNVDGSERWFGTSSVQDLGQVADPSTATIDLTINPGGSLRQGSLSVSRVRWGGLLTIQNLDLVARRDPSGLATWNVAGQLSIGTGGTTALTGSLVLQSGVVQSGSLSMSGVRIDELATIDLLDLVATRSGGVTNWAATLQVTSGGTQVAGSGSMRWSLGRLDSAHLELGDVELGELFTLRNFSVDFDNGARWAAAAELVDDDGTTALAGVMNFNDGVFASGTLDAENLQIGPLEFSDFSLIIDPAGTTTSTVCATPDPGGPGSRYAIAATIRTADGATTSLGGRFRLDDADVVEGVMCADDVQVADLFMLDDFLVVYSATGTGTQRTVSFDGSATVSNPTNPTTTWSATVGFDIRNRRLQAFTLAADGLNLGEWMTLSDAELTYDRAANASTWTMQATLLRPGPDDTQIAGTLQVEDGVIVDGSLSIADLPVGDLFTLEDVAIEFHGRRATFTELPFAAPGANTSCSATPADANVLFGAGASTGDEARFSVSANVRANGDTFAVRGQMGFGHGRLTGFDVTLACLPIGDFKTLEAVRVVYRSNVFLFAGRLQDEEGASSAGGNLVFDDGRLVGGSLTIDNMPLGIVQLDTLEVALGENPNGDTTFALTLSVENDAGDAFGGGGSLTMRDGRIVAGSLMIERLPFLDIFTIENFEILIDNSVTNRSRFAGGADVVLGGGGRAGMDIDLTFENGRLIIGSFEASQIELFEVIPIGGLSIAFDSIERSWSGSLDVSIPGLGSSTGPGIKLGVEFQRGKLVSGVFGFDADGDGEVDGLNADGSAPASGSGDFNGFPLKALYVRYCAPNSAAAFCEPGDADTWEGRIGFQLPSDGAPGLDASLRLRNGKFEAAQAEINGLSIPLYPGVFLNSLRAAIEINPRFLFAGGVGLTVGLPSGVFDIAAVDANLQFSEEPEPDPSLPPEAYEREYFRFYTEGLASFLELPLNLFTFVDVQTRGFVGVGGSIDFELVNNVLYVGGGAEGFVFDAGRLGLTNPRTGAPLTGPSAQVRGFTQATILGVDVIDAEFVANTIGAAGCATINLLVVDASVGAGLYWSDGSSRLTCDMGRFKIAGVSTAGGVFTLTDGAAALRSAPLEPAGLVAGQEFSEFDVAAGEELLGVEVNGIGGTPDVVLVAPDGTVYDLDDSNPSDDGVLIATSPGKRWFVIAGPTPGTWRVEASLTSVPLGEIAISGLLPEVDVTGSLAPSGEGFELSYAITEIPGQQVVFIERSTDAADGFTAAIGAATGASGQLTFTPGGSLTGGEREIIAQVMQDGFLREEVVVTTFDVPDGVPASAPTALVVTETAGGAQVSWQPPPSNGGRAITSYQISSTAGWSVTTDAAGRSAFLPIPGLTPGEVVPVLVEARTGMGWGAPAVAEFTSTQRTGLQYAFASVPEVLLPPSGGGTGGGGPPGDPGPVDPPTLPPVVTPGITSAVPPLPTAPSAVPPPTTQPPLATDLPATGGDTAPIVALAMVFILMGCALWGRSRLRPGDPQR